MLVLNSGLAELDLWPDSLASRGKTTFTVSNMFLDERFKVRKVENLHGVAIARPIKCMFLSPLSFENYKNVRSTHKKTAIHIYMWTLSVGTRFHHGRNS